MLLRQAMTSATRGGSDSFFDEWMKRQSDLVQGAALAYAEREVMQASMRAIDQVRECSWHIQTGRITAAVKEGSRRCCQLHVEGMGESVVTHVVTTILCLLCAGPYQPEAAVDSADSPVRAESRGGRSALVHRRGPTATQGVFVRQASRVCIVHTWLLFENSLIVARRAGLNQGLQDV